jgi:hypothetical protein
MYFGKLTLVFELLSAGMEPKCITMGYLLMDMITTKRLEDSTKIYDSNFLKNDLKMYQITTEHSYLTLTPAPKSSKIK